MSSPTVKATLSSSAATSSAAPSVNPQLLQSRKASGSTAASGFSGFISGLQTAIDSFNANKNQQTLAALKDALTFGGNIDNPERLQSVLDQFDQIQFSKGMQKKQDYKDIQQKIAELKQEIRQEDAPFIMTITSPTSNTLDVTLDDTDFKQTSSGVLLLKDPQKLTPRSISPGSDDEGWDHISNTSTNSLSNSIHSLSGDEGIVDIKGDPRKQALIKTLNGKASSDEKVTGVKTALREILGEEKFDAFIEANARLAIDKYASESDDMAKDLLTIVDTGVALDLEKHFQSLDHLLTQDVLNSANASATDGITLSNLILDDSSHFKPAMSMQDMQRKVNDVLDVGDHDLVNGIFEKSYLHPEELSIDDNRVLDTIKTTLGDDFDTYRREKEAKIKGEAARMTTPKRSPIGHMMPALVGMQSLLNRQLGNEIGSGAVAAIVKTTELVTSMQNQLVKLSDSPAFNQAGVAVAALALAIPQLGVVVKATTAVTGLAATSQEKIQPHVQYMQELKQRVIDTIAAFNDEKHAEFLEERIVEDASTLTRLKQKNVKREISDVEKQQAKATQKIEAFGTQLDAQKEITSATHNTAQELESKKAALMEQLKEIERLTQAMQQNAIAS